MTLSSTLMLANSARFWKVRRCRAPRRGGAARPASDRPSNTISPPVAVVGAARRSEEGRLAGAVRPDQPDDAPLRHLERHAVERDDAAEAQRHVPYAQQGLRLGLDHVLLIPAGIVAAPEAARIPIPWRSTHERSGAVFSP